MYGCPGYLLYRLVERLSGKAALELFIHTACAKLLGLPRTRQAAEGNLRRILNYVKGKEPTPVETASLRGQMVRLLARDLLSKYEAIRDPAHFEVPVVLELMPVLQDLLRRGRGVVLVTPHFGDTTMLFFGLARSGLTLHVMVNQLPPSAGDILAASGVGLRLADLGAGARYCLDALARNELVLLMTDMDYFPGGRTLDFFGAPFNPPHGPARLAQAAGAPVLPVYAIWDGKRHRLLSDDPIETAGAEQEAVEKAILRSMERFIGRHPEHWLIFHDPWDLQACARETRRQLRQIRLRGALTDAWRRLTRVFTRARI